MDGSFEQISVIGFMKHNGGIQFRKISEAVYQYRATVTDTHLNPGGITHGGFIMSLMDSGMGTAAYRCLSGQKRIATISFDVKFIAASTTDDVLLGTAKILRKTRSLVFIHSELHCSDSLIASAEGIWKVL